MFAGIPNLYIVQIVRSRAQYDKQAVGDRRLAVFLHISRYAKRNREIFTTKREYVAHSILNSTFKILYNAKLRFATTILLSSFFFLLCERSEQQVCILLAPQAEYLHFSKNMV